VVGVDDSRHTMGQVGWGARLFVP